MPISDIGALPVSVGLADYTALLEGRETMGNEKVGRYTVIGEDRVGQSVDATIWMTPDGIPVRAEGEVSATGDTVDFTFQLDLIRRGDQPDHLFEPPGGLDARP